MTSTNDGKDVKSNRTSGQKDKTYYIGLYKSLDAQLNGECELRERCAQLCEAWRSVHTLCLHSAPSTHPHLLAWIQRHTARTVLQTEWQSPTSQDEHARLQEAIAGFIAECHDAIAARHQVLAWESHLLARADRLRVMLRKPWGHPVLKMLLDPSGERPTTAQVLGWLREERGVVFAARLRQLALSKCDDLALTLLSAVMDRVRMGKPPVADIDLLDERKVSQRAAEDVEPSFESALSEHAGFAEIWDLLADMELVLLHKADRNTRLIDLAKQTPLPNGYQLVERLLSRLESSPREKKLWKNAKDVAVLISQVMITRCMVVSTCSGAVRSVLFWCARALTRAAPPARLPRVTAALAAPAATARHLHTLAAAVHAQQSSMSSELKPFVVELYVRAITFGMNELEKLKFNKTKEKEARSTEQTLASWFMQLGQLLGSSVRAKFECTLTAFSVHPTVAMYEKIKAAPQLPPVEVPETSKNDTEVSSEFGSWANDSHSMTNFVKTSETLNLNQSQHLSNVLSTAILTEGEMAGLPAELCQDIAVLLSGPRVKTLSWDMDRELLLENCRAYMERTHDGTRALTTELKYLNLDPANFQHLPEEDDNEDDLYYGIEKGYEHLVEIQEPQLEEIWEDAYNDPERTESCWSSSTEDKTLTRRKKKNKLQPQTRQSSDSDLDPLSLVAETKRTEKKKERPLSKERSKESRKKHKERKKEAKKEKKIGKKKDKTVSSMAKLVGVKMTKVTDDDNLIIESGEKLQNDSSENVLYDGQFSMDELKSPEKLKSPETLKSPERTAHKHVGLAVNDDTVRNRIGTPNVIPSVDDERANVQKFKLKTTQDIKEEMKKSMAKLIEFRRKRNESNSPKCSPSQSDVRAQLKSPLPNTINHKGSKINAMLAEKASEKLKAIKNEAKNSRPVVDYPNDLKHDGFKGCLNTGERKELKETNCVSSSQNKASVNSTNRADKQHASTPQQNTHLNSYQEFLKQLKWTSDAGLRVEEEPRPEKRKQIKPVSRVTPVIPQTVKEKPTQCAKPVNLPKKVENAPPTFSRLSYMHKNKQNEKPKQTMESILQNSVSEELDRRIDEIRKLKIKAIETTTNMIYSRVGNSANASKMIETKIEAPVIKPINLVKNTTFTNVYTENALLNNLLKRNTGVTVTNVKKTNETQPKVEEKYQLPTVNTALTGKDQQDILNMLGQKNELEKTFQHNKPNHKNTVTYNTQETDAPVPINTLNKTHVGVINKPTAEISILHKGKIIHEGGSFKLPLISNTTIMKTTALIQNSRPQAKALQTKKLKPHCTEKVNTEVNKTLEDNKSISKKYVAKPPVPIPKQFDDITEQNWTKVLDALRSQKTPIRGPNALDMAFKKDSYEKVNERNQRLKAEEKINTCFSTEQVPSKSLTSAEVKSISNLPIVKKHETTIRKPQTKTKKYPSNPVMMYSDIKKPGLLTELQKRDDPFISGIPNSEYEILDELMDDDLRQEIGELSSDDDSYSSAPGASKGIKITSIVKNNIENKKNIPISSSAKMNQSEVFDVKAREINSPTPRPVERKTVAKPLITSNEKVVIRRLPDKVVTNVVCPVSTPTPEELVCINDTNVLQNNVVPTLNDVSSTFYDPPVQGMVVFDPYTGLYNINQSYIDSSVITVYQQEYTPIANPVILNNSITLPVNTVAMTSNVIPYNNGRTLTQNALQNMNPTSTSASCINLTEFLNPVQSNQMHIPKTEMARNDGLTPKANKTSATGDAISIVDNQHLNPLQSNKVNTLKTDTSKNYRIKPNEMNASVIAKSSTGNVHFVRSNRVQTSDTEILKNILKSNDFLKTTNFCAKSKISTDHNNPVQINQVKYYKNERMKPKAHTINNAPVDVKSKMDTRHGNYVQSGPVQTTKIEMNKHDRLESHEIKTATLGVKSKNDTGNINPTQNNEVQIHKPEIDKNDHEINNATFDAKLKIDTNLNKTCERKVLSEVQEILKMSTISPETIDPKNSRNQRLSLERENKKDGTLLQSENKKGISDSERITNKRSAIVNREIYHRCNDPPIPLTYAPLKVHIKTIHKEIETNTNNVRNNLDDTEQTVEDKPCQENQLNSADLKAHENSKENKQTTTRRILLRSSNKLLASELTSLNSQGPVGRKTKVRLKSTTINKSDRTESLKSDEESLIKSEQKEKCIVSETEFKQLKNVKAKTELPSQDEEVQIDSSIRSSKRILNKKIKISKEENQRDTTLIMQNEQIEESKEGQPEDFVKNDPLQIDVSSGAEISNILHKAIDDKETLNTQIEKVHIEESQNIEAKNDVQLKEKVSKDDIVEVLSSPEILDTDPFLELVPKTSSKVENLGTKNVVDNISDCIMIPEVEYNDTTNLNETTLRTDPELNDDRNKPVSKQNKIESPLRKQITGKKLSKLVNEMESAINAITENTINSPIIEHKIIDESSTQVKHYIDLDSSRTKGITSEDMEINSHKAVTEIGAKGPEINKTDQNQNDPFQNTINKSLNRQVKKYKSSEKNLNSLTSNENQVIVKPKASNTPKNQIVRVENIQTGNKSENSNTKAKDIPQSYKDSIHIEEMPIPGNTDPLKRCVRVILPNKRTYKATVRGKMQVSFDTLFDDPLLKSMLLSSIHTRKRYTFNLQQISTADSTFVDAKVQEVKVLSHNLPKKGIADNVETVNLISDDEEDDLKIFKTECGVVKVRKMDDTVHKKHQKKFLQKCAIQLKRCDEPCKSDSLVSALLQDIDKTLNISKNIETNTSPDVIEIVDSSDEDESLPIKQQKIDKLKNMLLKDLGVETNILGNSYLNNKPGNRFNSEKNNTSKPVNTLPSETEVSNKIEKSLVDNGNSNASNSPEEHEHFTKISNECYVKLVRCDNLVRKYQNFKSTQTIADGDVLNCVDDMVAKLSRSDSFSILNNLGDDLDVLVLPDFITYDETNRFCMSSPVMEAFDLIATLKGRSKVAVNELSQEYDNIDSCVSDWLVTKRNLHFQDISYLKNDIDSRLDMSTDYETDFSNVSQSDLENAIDSVSSNIPSLKSITFKYIEDCCILTNLIPISNRHLKRKLPKEGQSTTNTGTVSDLKNDINIKINISTNYETNFANISESDLENTIDKSSNIPSLKSIMSKYFENSSKFTYLIPISNRHLKRKLPKEDESMTNTSTKISSMTKKYKNPSQNESFKHKIKSDSDNVLPELKNDVLQKLEETKHEVESMTDTVSKRFGVSKCCKKTSADNIKNNAREDTVNPSKVESDVMPAYIKETSIIGPNTPNENLPDCLLNSNKIILQQSRLNSTCTELKKSCSDSAKNRTPSEDLNKLNSDDHIINKPTQTTPMPLMSLSLAAVKIISSCWPKSAEGKCFSNQESQVFATNVVEEKLHGLNKESEQPYIEVKNVKSPSIISEDILILDVNTDDVQNSDANPESLKLEEPRNIEAISENELKCDPQTEFSAEVNDVVVKLIHPMTKNNQSQLVTISLDVKSNLISGINKSKNQLPESNEFVMYASHDKKESHFNQIIDFAAEVCDIEREIFAPVTEITQTPLDSLDCIQLLEGNSDSNKSEEPVPSAAKTPGELESVLVPNNKDAAEVYDDLAETVPSDNNRSQLSKIAPAINSDVPEKSKMCKMSKLSEANEHVISTKVITANEPASNLVLKTTAAEINVTENLTTENNQIQLVRIRSDINPDIIEQLHVDLDLSKSEEPVVLSSEAILSGSEKDSVFVQNIEWAAKEYDALSKTLPQVTETNRLLRKSIIIPQLSKANKHVINADAIPSDKRTIYSIQNPAYEICDNATEMMLPVTENKHIHLVQIGTDINPDIIEQVDVNMDLSKSDEPLLSPEAKLSAEVVSVSVPNIEYVTKADNADEVTCEKIRLQPSKTIPDNFVKSEMDFILSERNEHVISEEVFIASVTARKLGPGTAFASEVNEVVKEVMLPVSENNPIQHVQIRPDINPDVIEQLDVNSDLSKFDEPVSSSKAIPSSEVENVSVPNIEYAADVYNTSAETVPQMTKRNRSHLGKKIPVVNLVDCMKSKTIRKISEVDENVMSAVNKRSSDLIPDTSLATVISDVLKKTLLPVTVNTQLHQDHTSQNLNPDVIQQLHVNSDLQKSVPCFETMPSGEVEGISVSNSEYAPDLAETIPLCEVDHLRKSNRSLLGKKTPVISLVDCMKFKTIPKMSVVEHVISAEAIPADDRSSGSISYTRLATEISDIVTETMPLVTENIQTHQLHTRQNLNPDVVQQLDVNSYLSKSVPSTETMPSGEVEGVTVSNSVFNDALAETVPQVAEKCRPQLVKITPLTIPDDFQESKIDHKLSKSKHVTSAEAILAGKKAKETVISTEYSAELSDVVTEAISSIAENDQIQLFQIRHPDDKQQLDVNCDLSESKDPVLYPKAVLSGDASNSILNTEHAAEVNDPLAELEPQVTDRNCSQMGKIKPAINQDDIQISEMGDGYSETNEQTEALPIEKRASNLILRNECDPELSDMKIISPLTENNELQLEKLDVNTDGIQKLDMSSEFSVLSSEVISIDNRQSILVHTIENATVVKKTQTEKNLTPLLTIIPQINLDVTECTKMYESAKLVLSAKAMSVKEKASYSILSTDCAAESDVYSSPPESKEIESSTHKVIDEEIVWDSVLTTESEPNVIEVLSEKIDTMSEESNYKPVQEETLNFELKSVDSKHSVLTGTKFVEITLDDPKMKNEDCKILKNELDYENHDDTILHIKETNNIFTADNIVAFQENENGTIIIGNSLDHWVAHETVISSEIESDKSSEEINISATEEDTKLVQYDNITKCENNKLVQTDIQDNNSVHASETTDFKTRETYLDELSMTVEQTKLENNAEGNNYVYETQVFVEEVEIPIEEETAAKPNYSPFEIVTRDIKNSVPKKMLKSESNNIYCGELHKDDTNVDKSVKKVEYSKTILEKAATVVYKSKSGVILKGIEYKDAEIGPCYVFPIKKSYGAFKAGDALNVSGEGMKISEVDIGDQSGNRDEKSVDFKDVNLSDINLKVKMKKNIYLKVIKPKFTYSKYCLKRKADMRDIDFIEKRRRASRDSVPVKKYRKGKNIDTTRLTPVAMAGSSYSKDYKRVFDYYSSLKFSYSVAFDKESIDVYGLLKDWPIKGSVTNDCNDQGNDIYTIFSNAEPDAEIFDPSKLTLVEEISVEYNEEDFANNSIIEEINFNMGFGEGSGRVIQNLNGGAILKFSAATLSDVKQSQPFLLSGYDCNENNFLKTSEQNQLETIKRFYTNIQLRDKVRSYFKNTTVELERELYKEETKYMDYNIDALFPFELYIPKHIEPRSIETVVQVVQVGQLPVSAGAQNPVTCDPRVTQVSDASPSQCSVENSPHEDSQQGIKTEYTELTTADLSLPLVEEYVQHNQVVHESQESANIIMSNENIPIQTEMVKSEVKIELEEELPDDTDKPVENSEAESIKHNINNIEYLYDTNNCNAVDTDIHAFFSTERSNTPEEMPQQKSQNGSAEKTDQIAHAMNAAGITTTSETVTNTRAHALVNILSQKIRQGVNTSQNSTINYSKTTSINAMALQQALAQILPPPLNQTSATENNQQGQNVTSQVLHIVQGKNAPGNQITLVDNTQQSVISGSNTTPVLHIVQNKTGAPGANSNGSPAHQSNTFSGISLVDAGLQQGGNQLLHIVNTGNQKNNNAGQLLKRVNLLTNLTNVQGSNEQKMVQFVCKSADGKAIQLNAPHQRSMVLRLQPIETPNMQAAQPKPAENQELSPTQNTVNAANKESVNTQEIKSRSVYEENYAKFIQNSSNKPTVLEKSTSLPKFNQAFGKPVFQDGNQKQNEINSNSIPAVNTTADSSESQATDNAINIDHIGQISSPPLLLRKSPAQTSHAQTNLVQQIKQSIAPMNIQTMHGGVIYTRQIPVNIGGGQTINLITVPSTELIDDSGQKQMNQGDIEPSIIKIVPQSQGNSNAEVSPDDINVSSDNAQNPPQQPQPVLTQMRIKLPMLSKTPQMVSGTRVVRPSFFQIQRNVIGGANQPVYQQLVLTAAPPLGQQTIRLPQAQARQIKVPENQSSSESQMSSSTLEQLREFDMVLEQVKERSTVQPTSNSNNTFKLHATSTDITDSPTSATSTSAETTQVLYSIGSNQPLSVAYVNRKPTITTPTTSTFVRSPDSSGIADSPTSSTHVQLPHTVTTEASSNESTSTQQKPVKVSSRSKSRPKTSSNPPNSMKINTVPPKTSAQKPLEDEQTTQRILYILAEYKEQVENSPDKDKPAPRRRSNPPSNPGSSKRKKSSSSSRRPGTRDLSPVLGDDTCRTMGSEDSSCGTSQGDCNESCLETHSPQDSPRKVVRKLTFEQDSSVTPPRQQPQRNVIVADGQTITVARGTAGKPATAVLMPANYILPVSMVKGGQQIAIVTNRGPKLLTVGGGEGGATNALLLQRLIGPAGLKPVLTRPGVRHVRLPTAALHNLQAFNLTTATSVQPPDSTASPAAEPNPPELTESRAESSPWADRESEAAKPDRASSPDESEPWNLPSSADPHDYTYEETVRADSMDRTVLDPIPDRYSPDMEAQRIFDKMFDVDTKKSYIVDSVVDSPRCAYDIDPSDCDDKPYQVVQKKDITSHRQTRLAHVSAAALRHKYAILEHELRLQKSLSEECEDLGVDSPSASELFPEAELLFAASPAHEPPDAPPHHDHTPQPLLNPSAIQADMDDQIATDQLLPRDAAPAGRGGLDVGLGLEDVGLVAAGGAGAGGGVQAALDQEEFARAHPNTTFHSEPTDDEVVQPFTISSLKSRHITSAIFHRAPATVLMSAPSAVIAHAQSADPHPPPGAGGSLSSALVKDTRLARFDGILTDSRELHLSSTAAGHATQVIRRVCYDDKVHEKRFILDEPDGLIAGDDAKMVAEDSSRDATMESVGGDADDGASSPERHAELFWESNSERSESRRPMDFSSDSEKCCKSPSCDETNSTDSSNVGAHMRLDSVIKEAGRASADGSSADDTHPPLRTYPPKRMYHSLEGELERSLSGKTRAGERSPDSLEVRRRASGRGVVKRGCHCCNGSPVPPKPKKPRQRKPTMDFTST